MRRASWRRCDGSISAGGVHVSSSDESNEPAQSVAARAGRRAPPRGRPGEYPFQPASRASASFGSCPRADAATAASWTPTGTCGFKQFGEQRAVGVALASGRGPAARARRAGRPRRPSRRRRRRAASVETEPGSAPFSTSGRATAGPRRGVEQARHRRELPGGEPPCPARPACRSAGSARRTPRRPGATPPSANSGFDQVSGGGVPVPVEERSAAIAPTCFGADDRTAARNQGSAAVASGDLRERLPGAGRRPSCPGSGPVPTAPTRPGRRPVSTTASASARVAGEPSRQRGRRCGGPAGAGRRARRGRARASARRGFRAPRGPARGPSGSSSSRASRRSGSTAAGSFLWSKSRCAVSRRQPLGLSSAATRPARVERVEPRERPGRLVDGDDPEDPAPVAPGAEVERLLHVVGNPFGVLDDGAVHVGDPEGAVGPGLEHRGPEPGVARREELAVDFARRALAPAASGRRVRGPSDGPGYAPAR